MVNLRQFVNPVLFNISFQKVLYKLYCHLPTVAVTVSRQQDLTMLRLIFKAFEGCSLYSPAHLLSVSSSQVTTKTAIVGIATSPYTHQ